MSATVGYYAQESAIVEDGAQVGDGTRIWHHSQLRSGSSVGADCVLGKNVFIDTGAVVGDRCKLQNNVNVYDGVTIGEDVFVGPSATFTNDLVPRAFNAEWTITTTVVEDGVSVGAHATIVCGTTLGRFSMIAAGATVTRDVAPHELVAGTPARTLGWVCRCGQVSSRGQVAPIDPTCEDCLKETQ
jgi:UDP-2-acetamido-3-amino-2,3-dideoxy-glucuronate N-acetyltransferase